MRNLFLIVTLLALAPMVSHAQHRTPDTQRFAAPAAASDHAGQALTAASLTTTGALGVKLTSQASLGTCTSPNYWSLKSITGTEKTHICTPSGWMRIALLLINTASVNPAEIAAGAEGSVTFTLTSAVSGQAVSCNPATAALSTGLIQSYERVSGPAEVTIYFFNPTESPIDQAAVDFTCFVVL